jgi:membrane-associated HD superfamily phosphohydrolase
MLIDSIEAGARTVDPPTHDGFEELVRRVIFSKLKQGQLDDSTLTLHDLHVLAARITDTLVSVYHGRIRYPWQNERGGEPPHSDPDPKPTAALERPSGDTRLH